MPDKTDKTKQPANGSMLTRADQLAVHRLVIEEAQKKSPQEGFRDLVASGIYTATGKLAKQYGG